jgi:hypothetical protein
VTVSFDLPFANVAGSDLFIHVLESLLSGLMTCAEPESKHWRGS